MEISKEEMETILVMFGIVIAEDQETDSMVKLFARIMAEHEKWGMKMK